MTRSRQYFALLIHPSERPNGYSADRDPGNPRERYLQTQYTCDPLGRTISQTDQCGVTHEYRYTANRQLPRERELDELSAPVEPHVSLWGPRYIDAPILRGQYDEGGDLHAAARLSYLGDANFKVTALVDQDSQNPGTWEVAHRHAYDPDEKATVYDPAWDHWPVACGGGVWALPGRVWE